MKVFALDVIHDLQTKRVWPFAVALLVAIIAVPLVLLKPAAEPADTAVAPPAPAATPTSKVKLTSQPEGGSSRLEQFDSHNPFRPDVTPKEAAQAEKEAGEAASADSAGQGEPSPPPATDASPGGTTPSNGSNSEATPPGKSPAGGGGGSSNEPKNDSSNKSSGKNNNNSQETVKVEEDVRVLSYNAEASYGPAGKVKKHTVEPNDVFPRGERYFMYSGVSKDGKAIFTVLDPTLVSERKGEGHCVQVSGRCAVLHLKDGEERRFENEKGEAFVLRLGELDPVKKLIEDLSGKLRDTVDKLVDPLKP